MSFKLPSYGDAATLCGYSDRNAATVVFASFDAGPGKSPLIAVTEDEATVISGSVMDGSAEYQYKWNPGGYKYWFKWDAKKEKWQHIHKNLDTGRWVKGQYYRLRLGSRSTYRDPSF